MEKSLKSLSLNQGLILGAILSAFIIIAYLFSLDLMTKWWYGMIMLIVVIAYGTISSLKARKLENGYISFKNAFTAYFIAVLVGILISSIVSILIFNLIDNVAAVLLQEKIIEDQVIMLEQLGTPEEAIDQVIEKIESKGNLYSIGNILQSLVFQLVGYSIVGLIVALVIKKTDPNAA